MNDDNQGYLGSTQEDPLPFDRSVGLGGSDMAAVLGLSPFRSEWDVWLEKTHDPAWRPQPESAPMKLGKLLEPVIVEWYADKHRPELIVGYAPEIVWHPNGIIFGHVDAEVRAADYARQTAPVSGILEAKTVRDDREWPGKPPPYYETQGRTYLALVPEAQWLDFAVLYRSSAEFDEYRLERDRRLEDGIIRAGEQWWEKRVVRGEPPPMDASSGATAYLAARYPRQTTEDLLLYDNTFEQTVLALLATKAAIKRHTENEAKLRNMIVERMGEYPRAEGVGWHIIFNRVKGATTTSWKEVALALRKVIQDYRNPPDGVTRLQARRLLDEVDLDALQSIYTRTNEGHRPLLVKED